MWAQGHTQALPAPVIHSMEDFPLEQSRDSALCSAFDQGMETDDQMVRSDVALTYSLFVMVRDRLC